MIRESSSKAKYNGKVNISEQSDIVSLMEKEWPEMTAEFKKLQREQYELFCKKQHDYGDSNIRLGLDLDSSSSERSQNNRLAQLGIVIRMNDKISRLINLYKKDMEESSAVKESIEDTAIDMMNYANMLMVLRANKWGK